MRQQACTASTVVLEAEQANDVAEQEVEDLKHALGGKRARNEASTIEDDKGMPASDLIPCPLCRLRAVVLSPKRALYWSPYCWIQSCARAQVHS